MVSGSGIPVSLGEVLEVRELPLDEDQIWSILSRGMATLEQFIAKSKGQAKPPWGFSTDTILFLPDGEVCLKAPTGSRSVSAGSAPEDGVYGTSNAATAEEVQYFFPPDPEKFILGPNDNAIAKIYTYSFGAALNYAMTYGNQPLSSSPELYSLLNLMTISQPDIRPSIAKIGQMVANKVASREINPRFVITDLYRSIMGSDEDLHVFQDDLAANDLKLPLVDDATQSTPRKESRELGTSPTPIPPSECKPQTPDLLIGSINIGAPPSAALIIDRALYSKEMSHDSGFDKDRYSNFDGDPEVLITSSSTSGNNPFEDDNNNPFSDDADDDDLARECSQNNAQSAAKSQPFLDNSPVGGEDALFSHTTNNRNSAGGNNSNLLMDNIDDSNENQTSFLDMKEKNSVNIDRDSSAKTYTTSILDVLAPQPSRTETISTSSTSSSSSWSTKSNAGSVAVEIIDSLQNEKDSFKQVIHAHSDSAEIVDPDKDFLIDFSVDNDADRDANVAEADSPDVSGSFDALNVAGSDSTNYIDSIVATQSVSMYDQAESGSSSDHDYSLSSAERDKDGYRQTTEITERNSEERPKQASQPADYSHLVVSNRSRWDVAPIDTSHTEVPPSETPAPFDEPRTGAVSTIPSKLPSFDPAVFYAWLAKTKVGDDVLSLTDADDHRRHLERTRLYHSLRCAFCAPERRRDRLDARVAKQTQKYIGTRRWSLPNMLPLFELAGFKSGWDDHAPLDDLRIDSKRRLQWKPCMEYWPKLKALDLYLLGSTVNSNLGPPRRKSPSRGISESSSVESPFSARKSMEPIVSAEEEAEFSSSKADVERTVPAEIPEFLVSSSDGFNASILPNGETRLRSSTEISDAASTKTQLSSYSEPVRLAVTPPTPAPRKHSGNKKSFDFEVEAMDGDRGSEPFEGGPVVPINLNYSDIIPDQIIQPASVRQSIGSGSRVSQVSQGSLPPSPDDEDGKHYPEFNDYVHSSGGSQEVELAGAAVGSFSESDEGDDGEGVPAAHKESEQHPLHTVVDVQAVIERSRRSKKSRSSSSELDDRPTSGESAKRESHESELADEVLPLPLSKKEMDMLEEEIRTYSEAIGPSVPPDGPVTSTNGDHGSQPSTSAAVFDSSIAARSSFVRRGSMRRSGTHRSSRAGSRRGSMAGPEFLFGREQKSIRLKAVSVVENKRSSSLPQYRSVVHLLEGAGVMGSSHGHKSVLVLLLNGQRVDVDCTVQTRAGEIFETIATHINLTDHFLFGLTYLKDGEHYFLEPQEKIGKYGPATWKHPKATHTQSLYTLFLRLKCYPESLDFVSSDQTIHQLYLQLRRDLIDERLQCSRDKAYALAALALQVEYGDSPLTPSALPATVASEIREAAKSNYFQLNHYLPQRHYANDNDEDQKPFVNVLSELHLQYSGMSSLEAKKEFLRDCTGLREYGIHFHRLFKSKPSSAMVVDPLGDPDTGTSLWVGILPRGVIIFEEMQGERVPTSRHPWHLTNTLQFDRKKFVIIPKLSTIGPDGEQSQPSEEPGTPLVFYSDSHKKSAYFVKFAIAQHKFGMRMRRLLSQDPTGTLGRGSKTNSDGVNGSKRLITNGSSHSNQSSLADSGISQEPSPTPVFETVRSAGRERLTTPNRSSARLSNLHDSPSSIGKSPRNRGVQESRGFSGSGSSAGAEHSHPSSPATPGRSGASPRGPNAGGLGHGDDLESGRSRQSRTSEPRSSQRARHNYAGSGSYDVTREIDDGLKMLNISEPSRDQSLTVDENETLSKSLAERLSISSSDYDVFTVHLIKVPHFGLGLTLVDGEIQSLKGIYVKSVTSGGPADTNGRLKIGDRLVSINGILLDEKNRHDAVDLVRQASSEVQITVMRLRCLYSSDESLSTAGVSGANSGGENFLSHPSDRVKTLPADYSMRDIDSALGKESGGNPRLGAGSVASESSLQVPSADGSTSARKTHNYFDKPKRQSDVYLKLADPPSALNKSATMPASLSGTLSPGVDDSDAESGTDEEDAGTEDDYDDDGFVNGNSRGRTRGMHKAEYKVQQRIGETADLNGGTPRGSKSMSFLDEALGEVSPGHPISSSTPMSNYNGHGGEDRDEGSGHKKLAVFNGSVDTTNGNWIHPSLSGSTEDLLDSTVDGTADWTDSLSVHDVPEYDPDLEECHVVELFKNEKGGLGIKIAGGGTAQKRVYVKALVGEPAVSCPNIKVGDRIISINDRDTRPVSHQEIVAMLKASGSPCRLGLSRPKQGAVKRDGSIRSKQSNVDYELLTVDLVKSDPDMSLGLSLGRPPPLGAGGDEAREIFIRGIAPTGLAAKDGRLKVGDRLIMIDGIQIENSAPKDVVEKMKLTVGGLELVVKREKR